MVSMTLLRSIFFTLVTCEVWQVLTKNSNYFSLFLERWKNITHFNDDFTTKNNKWSQSQMKGVEKKSRKQTSLSSWMIWNETFLSA